VRPGWQALRAPSRVRPRPGHHCLSSRPCWPLVGLSRGGARVQGGAPGRRRPLPSRCTCLCDVAAGSAVLPGPEGGRRARVEDRSATVLGPTGPGSAGSHRWWCRVTRPALGKGARALHPARRRRENTGPQSVDHQRQERARVRRSGWFARRRQLQRITGLSRVRTCGTPLDRDAGVTVALTTNRDGSRTAGFAGFACGFRCGAARSARPRSPPAAPTTWLRCCARSTSWAARRSCSP